jgi:hypothetical protein
MRTIDQRRVLFHGAILLLVGMLYGIPFAEVLVDGGDVAARPWRVAHTGLVAGAVLLIAVSAAMPHVMLGPRGTSWLVGSLVLTAYGAIVGLGLPPLAGVRGLAPEGPPLNLVAFAGNLVVGVGSLVAGVLLVHGAHAALRDAAR